MIAFVVQRLFQAALVMLAVALIAFALFNFVGDPINNMVGQDTSLADRDRLRQELGLNDSFLVQFARFVGHAATGEFGLSYQQARPVGKIILEKMPATLELSFLAAALALLVGVPMGICPQPAFLGCYPPPLKWSTLSYGFCSPGGPQCRGRATSRKRSSPSCGRLMF